MTTGSCQHVKLFPSALFSLTCSRSLRSSSMSDTQLRKTRPDHFTTQTKTRAHKDTRRPFSATHQVEARCDDVLCLASSCQMFTDHHLEEVEGCV